MQAYNTAYTSFTEPVESTQHFGSKVVSHWVEQLLMGNNFLIKLFPINNCSTQCETALLQ